MNRNHSLAGVDLTFAKNEVIANKTDTKGMVTAAMGVVCHAQSNKQAMLPAK